MSAQSCLVTEDQVMAYVAGDVEPETGVELAQHLAECDACREVAVEYRTLTTCFEQVPATGALRWSQVESPFGALYLAATDQGLAWVSWRQPHADAVVAILEERFPDRPVVTDAQALAGWATQLVEYFAGKRTVFDLPVDLTALSDFERSVLEAARSIPYGEVIPYAEVARRIENPGASRAVGNALGHNPVAIVVPCHRVVKSDGSLGGYTGGEQFKRRLLAIEGRLDLPMAG
jgi:methylated-DNA-[protein]-cysteine S-methyltransferase